MSNKELYKSTFSHLHASSDVTQEAKHVKKGYIKKSLLIGAAAAALMATAAGAANIATDGAFFDGIKMFVVGDYTRNEDGTITFNVKDEEGSEVTVDVYTGEIEATNDLTISCGYTDEDPDEDTSTHSNYDASVHTESEKSGSAESFAVVDESGEVVYVQSVPDEAAYNVYYGEDTTETENGPKPTQ